MDAAPAPERTAPPPGGAAPVPSMRTGVAEPPAPEGTLHVAVVTPEGAAYSGPASSVVVPGHDGLVGFLPGHAAFLGALGVGTLAVTAPDGRVERFLLEGGVVQVLDDRVTVLAERVTPASAVDASAARREIEDLLRSAPATEAALAERDRALALARARIALAR